jgi:type I restriction enzyme R subunit
MESYRIRESFRGRLPLERGGGEVRPIGGKDAHATAPPEQELLSQILRELNERFGTDFTEEDRVFIQQLEQKLASDTALAASVRVNTPENARLTFDHVVTDRLQEMVDTNFKFYKRVTDDREIRAVLRRLVVRALPEEPGRVIVTFPSGPGGTNSSRDEFGG